MLKLLFVAINGKAGAPPSPVNTRTLESTWAVRRCLGCRIKMFQALVSTNTDLIPLHLVGSEDEVLIVELAEVLDLDLLVLDDEAVEEGVGLAGLEGIADEQGEVLAVADEGGDGDAEICNDGI